MNYFNFLLINTQRQKLILRQNLLSRLIRNSSSIQLLKENLIHPTSGNLALVSLSHDIHYNLALEQFIADNYDFTHRSIMLLWSNEPCVVVGRYQNPWLECNLVEMKKRNVKLARRHSGGGCVYHGMK
jgi:lipoyltransferase 1